MGLRSCRQNRERIPPVFLEAPDIVVFLEGHRKPEPCATAVSGLPPAFPLAVSLPLSLSPGLLLTPRVSPRVSSVDWQYVRAHTHTHTNAIVTNLALSPSADLDNRSFHADMHNCAAI